MPKTALILSSGRTGTLFLARYFDANYEGVVARHEPPPARWLRLASHAHMAGCALRRAAARAAGLQAAALRRRLRRRPLRRVEPVPVGLRRRSGRGLGRADDHPRGARSARARPLLAEPRDGQWPEGARQPLPPLLVPRRPPDPEARSPTELARAGRGRVGDRQLAAVRTRRPATRDYHLLRYEEIFDASHSGLREMCRILGLEYREAGAAVAPSRTHQSRPPRRPAALARVDPGAVPRAPRDLRAADAGVRLRRTSPSGARGWPTMAEPASAPCREPARRRRRALVALLTLALAWRCWRSSCTSNRGYIAAHYALRPEAFLAIAALVVAHPRPARPRAPGALRAHRDLAPPRSTGSGSSR